MSQSMQLSSVTIGMTSWSSASLDILGNNNQVPEVVNSAEMTLTGFEFTQGASSSGNYITCRANTIWNIVAEGLSIENMLHVFLPQTFGNVLTMWYNPATQKYTLT